LNFTNDPKVNVVLDGLFGILIGELVEHKTLPMSQSSAMKH